MVYSIEKIATLIGARRIGSADAQIRWLLTDSRSLCFAEETLFFAIRTAHGDGHRYIDELYKRGVRNFVVESEERVARDETRGMSSETRTAHFADANFLVVPSPLAALQRLAERHRDEFNCPVVGITGSNGKTMVKEWLYQVLSPSLRVTRSPKSYNSQIGVPLSVWLMNEHTQVALFEAGISQPDEMDRLADIIQPTIGILTSIGDAHQENFRSKEEKCMEKLKLFEHSQAIVYNADDDLVSRCLRRSGYKGKKIGWHRSELLPKYELPFDDEASIECSMAVAATALHLGIGEEELRERMARLEPVAMRLEVKEGLHGCTLINDSYNSDINSLDIALDFMSRRASAANALPTTLILSDIYQSGMSDDELYTTVDSLLTKRSVSRLIGIGPRITAHSYIFRGERREGRGENGETVFFDTTDDFLASDTFRSLHDEMILIKGARTFGFDRITERLEQRVHETILEVNLGALADNLNHFRSFLKPDTKMVCMVKADAYGAGAVEVSKTLQEHRVDYLAVAVADEGATLRNNGITQNIMVMNPEMTAFKTIFDYDLEPEVYSFRLMEALIRAAQKEGITGWPVHIKLDTGMHRLGFDPENDMEQLIERLKSQNAIIPRSVFSHFVGSDSNDFDDFSARQFQLFDRASSQLQAAFSHKILRHIDNSAGIEHFPERQLDMCRLGIGLYGVEPYVRDIPYTLKCVSTLKTTILQLRHVKAGDSIGYSRRTILERDSVIGAIPIGYADGLNRRLGNRHGYCLVNGQKAEYVGNICMDVAMIDVTDISDVHEGDQVEIFGSQLPVTVLSDQLETIPYEVLTAVSGRVKRVYYQD